MGQDSQGSWKEKDLSSVFIRGLGSHLGEALGAGEISFFSDLVSGEAIASVQSREAWRGTQSPWRTVGLHTLRGGALMGRNESSWRLEAFMRVRAQPLLDQAQRPGEGTCCRLAGELGSFFLGGTATMQAALRCTDFLHTSSVSMRVPWVFQG